MRPCTARTDDHSSTPWADITWHAVEGKVRRLQERIYRAPTHQAGKRVNNLQQLRGRATSNPLLALRRVTQENPGKHTAGIDGVVYDTPEARWRLLQEGLSLQGDKPRPVRRVSIPQDNGKHSPLGLPTGKDRVRQAIVTAALEPAWAARLAAHSYGFRPGRGTLDAIAALHTTLHQQTRRPWRLDAEISGCFDSAC